MEGTWSGVGEVEVRVSRGAGCGGKEEEVKEV